MNKSNIIRKIREFYKNYLKSIQDDNIKNIIKNYTFVNGGAITSMLLNEPVNDFDIYFDDVEKCKEVIRYYLKKLNKTEGNSFSFHNYENMKTNEGEIKDRVKLYIPHGGVFKSKRKNKEFYPIFVSTNAMTLTNDVQLIFRFVGTPEKIHENYDFEHTKCYYTYGNNELVLPQKAIEAILMKELKYSGSKYPLASIIRTRKFIQRGWSINAGQFLKMALQLQEINLKDPIVLSDQLCGVDIMLFDEIIKRISEKQFEENENISEYLIDIIDEVFDGIGIDTSVNEDNDEVNVGNNEDMNEDFDETI